MNLVSYNFSNIKGTDDIFFKIVYTIILITVWYSRIYTFGIF